MSWAPRDSRQNLATPRRPMSSFRLAGLALMAAALFSQVSKGHRKGRPKAPWAARTGHFEWRGGSAVRGIQWVPQGWRMLDLETALKAVG